MEPNVNGRSGGSGLVRLAAPWVLLAAGLSAIYFAACIARHPGSRPPTVAGQPYNHWLADLDGTRVSVPARDSQGFRVPKGRLIYAVTLDCASCSVRQGILDSIRSARRKPVLVVTTSRLSEVPAEYRSRPDDFLVLCDPLGKSLPSRLLDKAPQAMLLDGRGVVVKSPGQGQKLAEFLGGSGS